MSIFNYSISSRHIKSQGKYKELKKITKFKVSTLRKKKKNLLNILSIVVIADTYINIYI